MCGLAGIVSHSPVNQELYDALTVLQHRGQDAAGIVTVENGQLHLRKDNGLVRDVFRTRNMRDLSGDMGIAHCRYPTAGSTSSAEAQPLYVNSPYGLTLAHNGNLTNDKELHEYLCSKAFRHINTGSDSEILLNVLADELATKEKVRLEVKDVFEAVAGVHRRCQGGYSAVAMISGFGLLGFRDPHGIRPLVFGQRDNPDGTVDWMVASESVALDVLGYRLIRDVEPGEAIFIEADGTFHNYQCAAHAEYWPCLFEFVYFARPDSIMDNISVYKARLRMGEKLAKRILTEWDDVQIDVVIPIPDTSRTAALPLAYELGAKYREGFIKNRYIGRTFIMPGQQERKKSVRQKLNPIELEFRGKNVLLVDDSIVRGTTSKQIIQMARDCGANQVFFASAAPPVRHPNVYGIDMPSASELIAHGRTVEEVCAEIGADRLIFQDLDDLVSAVSQGNPRVKHFDASVFNGVYPAGELSADYLEQLELIRGDSSRTKKKSGNNNVIELHNAS